MIRTTGAVLAILISGGLAMAAENRCRITDPTDTPLNVRTSPYGAVIDTIENGRLVYVIDHATDTHGKPWVYISDFHNETPIGWVYREYISCF